MKLLICTQAVDAEDPVLGFFCRWIEEFAKHCEEVSVICLRKGQYRLPPNVSVYSLGKERGAVSRIQYALRFWQLLFRLRREYDAAFVHMNPEYVVLGGLFWRLARKKIGLWYVHKSVDLKLRIAEKFANAIFTASPESFRLRSKKVQVVGHGIDTGLFSCSRRDSRGDASPAGPSRASSLESVELKLITVSRIAPSKGLEVLLDALEILHARGVRFSLDIVGAPAREGDISYDAILRARVMGSPFPSAVNFFGPKKQGDVAKLLCGYDLFLNASRGTGSLDKAVLEALAAGVPAVSTNEAFRDILAPYGLFASAGTGESIARAIEQFRARGDAREIAQKLCQEIRARHSLPHLISSLAVLLHT